MTTSLGTLVVYLTANASQYKRAMKDVESSQAATIEAMIRTTKYGAAAIIGTLAAIGAASVVEFAKFEDSFAGVRKTIDATESQYLELQNTFRSMALRMPVNVNEINKVAEAAGQLGIKRENIASFTETMVKMGTATNLASDQAATELARLANITQMPQTEFNRLGSSIVALGNNFATTESEISSMALRLAGAGKQIGMTEAQTLGFAAALSSVGIEAEAGGTAMSTAMIQIASAVAMGGKELEMFAALSGQTTAEFSKHFKEDAAGAILSFIEGLGKFSKSGGNTFEVLEGLGIQGIRLTDALLRASGAGDLFRRSLDVSTKAWRDNNALTSEADKRYATLISQGTILLNVLRDIFITIGQHLVPVITVVNASLRDFLKETNNAQSGVKSLSDVIRGTLVASIGVALDAFYGWQMMFLITENAFTALGRIVAWFCKSGEVLILSLSTVFEKSLRGWDGLFKLTAYALKRGLSEFLLWVEEKRLQAYESLNKLPAPFARWDTTQTKAEIERLTQALAEMKAPDLDMTTANGAALEQATAEWKKFADEEDVFAQRIIENRKKLWELAEQGAPSEKFNAAIAQVEADIIAALKDAPEKAAPAVAAVVTEVDNLARSINRITPEFIEFKEMTKDPLASAYESVKKFAVVLNQGQITLDRYKQSLRDVLSASNPFIAPVAGMQTPEGINSDADQMKSLANEELLLTDSFNRKLQATNDYYASAQEAAVMNNEEVIRLEAEKQAILEEMGFNYTNGLTNIANRAQATQLQATSFALSAAGNGFQQMATLLKTSGKESSGAYKAMFIAAQTFAATMAIVNAWLAYTQLMAAPEIPFISKPVLGAIVLAGGFAAAATIAATTLTSFEGGGMTGDGPRNGGMDGKGGFLAMLHPQERVTDLTKDDDPAAGGGSAVVVNVHNYGNDQASVSTSPDGKIIDVVIKKVREAVANDIATGRGAIPSAFQSTYKLSRG